MIKYVEKVIKLWKTRTYIHKNSNFVENYCFLLNNKQNSFAIGLGIDDSRRIIP